MRARTCKQLQSSSRTCFKANKGQRRRSALFGKGTRALLKKQAQSTQAARPVFKYTLVTNQAKMPAMLTMLPARSGNLLRTVLLSRVSIRGQQTGLANADGTTYKKRYPSLHPTTEKWNFIDKDMETKLPSWLTADGGQNWTKAGYSKEEFERMKRRERQRQDDIVREELLEGAVDLEVKKEQE